MSDIYAQHDAAFRNVSAFVIMRDGEKVATVALKYPRDGAGRLFAYVHWLGLPMVRAYAGGYGYDKRTAAVGNAARKMDRNAAAARADETGLAYAQGRPWFEYYAAFIDAASKDGGEDWARALEKAGFNVLQAV
jgi:hypothetical protein